MKIITITNMITMTPVSVMGASPNTNSTTTRTSRMIRMAISALLRVESTNGLLLQDYLNKAKITI